MSKDIRNPKKDFDDVKSTASIIAFILSLPNLTFPSVLAFFVNPFDFSGSDFEIIKLYFLLTAPLTLAFAFNSLWAFPLIRSISRGQKIPRSGIWMFGLLGVFLFWVAGQISINLLDIPGYDITYYTDEYSSFGRIKYIIALFRITFDYFTLYGAFNFFASLLLGSFVGWIWTFKVIPYME